MLILRTLLPVDIYTFNCTSKFQVLEIDSDVTFLQNSHISARRMLHKFRKYENLPLQ